MTLLVAFSSLSWAGGESGGGGGTVIRNGKNVLIDFFEIDSNFKEPALPAGMSDEMFLQEILEQWAALPLDTNSYMILSALDGSVEWRFTERRLPAFQFSPPLCLSSEEIHLAAYYRANSRLQMYAVDIVEDIWAQTGTFSRAGLRFHESLRHVQLGLQNGFDEKTLQQATAAFMMCKPNIKLNFYLSFLLANNRKLAEEIHGPFQSVISKHCERIY